MASKTIMDFVRDYARYIFRFYFWNDNVCFFVLIYEMDQFKQKMERGFSLCFSAIGTVFILIRKCLPLGVEE